MFRFMLSDVCWMLLLICPPGTSKVLFFAFFFFFKLIDWLFLTQDGSSWGSTYWGKGSWRERKLSPNLRQEVRVWSEGWFYFGICYIKQSKTTTVDWMVCGNETRLLLLSWQEWNRFELKVLRNNRNLPLLRNCIAAILGKEIDIMW